MALFGAVGEYVEGEEDWSQYVERLGLECLNDESPPEKFKEVEHLFEKA